MLTTRLRFVLWQAVSLFRVADLPVVITSCSTSCCGLLSNEAVSYTKLCFVTRIRRLGFRKTDELNCVLHSEPRHHGHCCQQTRRDTTANDNAHCTRKNRKILAATTAKQNRGQSKVLQGVRISINLKLVLANGDQVPDSTASCRPAFLVSLGV